LQGHIGEVSVTKWFPSGKVVLTGAQDLQLKIWDAMTGQCAATLKGHAGAITDAVMIDRGRNLICTPASLVPPPHSP
jgi:proteasomal ATPase-associated factor 1